MFKKILSVLMLCAVLNNFAFADLANPFYDLSADHKNNEAILRLRELGIVNGYADGTFKPDGEINRAEFFKILVEGTGVTPDVSYSDCFDDVKTEWFAPYVCYGKEAGWVDGYGDGTFKPEQTVNNVEAVKMILNSQEFPLAEESDPFHLSGAVSYETAMGWDDQWWAPYMSVAFVLGILEYDTSGFEPGELMTRGGVSENLYGLLKWFEYNRDLLDLAVQVGDISCQSEQYDLLADAHELFTEKTEAEIDTNYFAHYYWEEVIYSPLHVAANNGCFDVVKDLYDIDGYVGDKYSPTVLSAAVVGGNLELITYLLDEEGVDIDEKGQWLYQLPPLYRAISAGDIEVATLLVEKGADVEDYLDDAAGLGDYDLFYLMLEEYLAVNWEVDDDFLSPSLNRAVGSGNTELVQFILDEGAKINNDVYGGTALDYAVFYENLDMIEWLIGKGADVNNTDGKGETVLCTAVQRGSVEALDLLVENGADLENSGCDLLNLAVVYEHLDVVKALIDYGVVSGIDTPYESGLLMLDYAAQYADIEMCEALLGIGADVNSTYWDGWTPLIHAIEGAGYSDHDAYAISEFLVEKGADVNILNDEDESALHFAAYYGFDDVVDLLLENGSDVDVITYPQGANRSPFVRGTALHIAVKERHYNIAKMLIDHGADVNAKYGVNINDEGVMPLHLAAQNDDFEMVKLLLKNGADVNAFMPPQLDTALDLAESEEVMELLVEHGGLNRKDF